MIGDSVRDDLMGRFDDVMDVLVHVDPEDDEAMADHSRPFSRSDVQGLLDKYLTEVKASIDDLRIHYLDGRIEVEVILPFAVSEQPQQLAQLKKQCRLMKIEVKKIDNVRVFFKI
jgi:hypothetical protein